MTQRSTRPPPRFRKLILFLGTAPMTLAILISGCSTIEQLTQGSGSSNGGVIMPSNFDQALEENQRGLTDGKSQRDIALYNVGVISAHSANPSKDYSRAMLSFKTLVNEYPNSSRVEQAKIWLQALEEIQKTNEEAKKVTEDKHALAHERNQLAQERNQLAEERQKLNYAIEKSRQLDAAIEKRRKQSLRR